MKTKLKLRCAADISGAILLITGATIALVLAPEIGIAIAPPMITGAIKALDDAKRIGLKNPLRFFHRRKRNEEDEEHQCPRNNSELN